MAIENMQSISFLLGAVSKLRSLLMVFVKLLECPWAAIGAPSHLADFALATSGRASVWIKLPPFLPTHHVRLSKHFSI